VERFDKENRRVQSALIVNIFLNQDYKPTLAFVYMIYHNLLLGTAYEDNPARNSKM